MGDGKRKTGETEGASKLDERVVPFLLLLPNCLTKKLLNKAYWMPHKLLKKLTILSGILIFN